MLGTRHIILFLQVGRKALLLLGSVGMFFSMLMAATLIVSFRGLEEEEDNNDKAVGYVVVLLVCFFVFNFAYSWG